MQSRHKLLMRYFTPLLFCFTVFETWSTGRSFSTTCELGRNAGPELLLELLNQILHVNMLAEASCVCCRLGIALLQTWTVSAFV